MKTTLKLNYLFTVLLVVQAKYSRSFHLHLCKYYNMGFLLNIRIMLELLKEVERKYSSDNAEKSSESFLY